MKIVRIVVVRYGQPLIQKLMENVLIAKPGLVTIMVIKMPYDHSTELKPTSCIDKNQYYCKHGCPKRIFCKEKNTND